MPVGVPQTMALGGIQHAPRQGLVGVQVVTVDRNCPPAWAHWVLLTSEHVPFGRQHALSTGGHGLGVQVVLTMFTHGPKQKA